MAKRKTKPKQKTRPEIRQAEQQLPASQRWTLPAVLAVGAALFAIFMALRSPGTAPAPTAEPTGNEVSAPASEPSAASLTQPSASPLSTLPPTLPGDLSQAAEAKFNEGVMLAQSGELEKSIAVFEEVRKLVPLATEPITNIGQAYIQLGRFDDAVRIYEEAARIDPNDANMIDMLGVAYGYKGDVDSALAQFRRAIVLEPFLASAYCNAGLALAKKSNNAEAIKMLERAIELDPVMTRAYGNLAGIYLQSGRENEIEPLMRKLQAANPNDPMAAAVIKELLGAVAQSGSSTPTPAQD